MYSRILRRCIGAWVRQAKRVWMYLPPSLQRLPLGLAYGRHLHRMVSRYANRKQYFATFFLRNRPELELMQRLLDQKHYGSRLDLSVLACSKGAEVYSMAWAIRSARPDLQLKIIAVDISQEIVDFAEKGVYSLDNTDALASSDEESAKGRGEVSWNTSRDQNAWIFGCMSEEEIDAMFEVKGNQASIKPWLKEGITWITADANDPKLPALIGPQDIVVANRFICHMEPSDARRCLQNVARLIRQGGYLFVSGIDLDVRTRVALEMGWKPVTDLLREVHEGDVSIRLGWPLEYWGLEPLDDRRPDWQDRYASVFQIGKAPSESKEQVSVMYSGR